MSSFEEMDSSTEESGSLLFFKKNGEKGSAYPLTEGVTTIGGSLEAHIRLKIQDIRLEHIHCVVNVNRNGIATIINKSKYNPVRINNAVVKESIVLRDKDMIEVVGKKFQYQNHFIIDQDIDAANTKLLKKETKKSPALKTKTVLSRNQNDSKVVVSKALPASMASKRRLSLPLPEKTHFSASKLGPKIPQSSLINAPKRDSLRKSILKKVPADKKSLTRKIRNKLASDESEALHFSRFFSFSSLSGESASEIDTADEDLLLNETQHRSTMSVSKRSDNTSKIQRPYSRKSIHRNTSVVKAAEIDQSTESGKSPNTSTKVRKYSKTNTPRMADLSVNLPDFNVSSTKQNKSNVESPQAKKSLKFNKSLPVVGNSSMKYSSLEDEIFARTSLPSNRVEPPLSRKSVKINQSLAKYPDISDKKSVHNKSQMKTPGTRKSVKGNQSVAEDFKSSKIEDNVYPTPTSSARKSGQNKSLRQTPGPRKSLKANHSQADDLDFSKIEDNVSPTRTSSVRKSLQNKSQIQTPGPRKSVTANQSVAENFNFEIEENFSPIRTSSARKRVSQIQTPGTRKSVKGNQSLTEDLNSSKVEDNVFPTRTSSVRKSLHNKSLTQTPGLRESLKANQSLTENVNLEIEDNFSPTAGKFVSHIQTRGSRKSVKATDLDSSKIKENIFRRSSFTKNLIQTPDSRELVADRSLGEYFNSSKIDDTVSSSGVSSVKTNRQINDKQFTVNLTPLNYSDAAYTPRSWLTRKSGRSRSLSVTSSEAQRSRSDGFLHLDNVENNITPGNRRSVVSSKASDPMISPILSNKKFATNLDHTYSKSKDSLNKSNSQIENSTTLTFDNIQRRRSSRIRKLKLEDDFDYSLHTSWSDSTPKKSDLISMDDYGVTEDSTVQLGTSSNKISIGYKSLSDVSVLDGRLSDGKNISLTSDDDNSGTTTDASADDDRSSGRKLWKERTSDSIIDLSTPARRSSASYRPITEDITPATPLTTSRSDLDFKTPINTPQLFENIRDSVLKCRSRLHRSSTNGSGRESSVVKAKATKRPRQSTSSSPSRSHKRMKLDLKHSSLQESMSSFSSFGSEDVLEKVDANDVIPNTSKHIVDLTTKPVITCPPTRFSAGPQRKKSEPFRRSSASDTTVDVGQTMSETTESTSTESTLTETDSTVSEPQLKASKTQKGPKNDLSDLRGVKRLLKTPRVQKSPQNDLTNVLGVKKLFASPKEMKSPKNDLRSVPNLRRIMSPRQQNTPKNDLSDVRGLKKLLGTPKERKEPLNDLSDVGGLKKLMRTPKAQKEPLNDIGDLEGVVALFNTSVHHRLSNASDIENNEDLFNKIFNRKPLKTYRSKSMSPNKSLDAFGTARKTIGDRPTFSPRVSVWIDEQAALNKKLMEKIENDRPETGKKRTRGRLNKPAKPQESLEDVQSATVSEKRRKLLIEDTTATQISTSSKTRSTRRNKRIEKQEDGISENNIEEASTDTTNTNTKGNKGKKTPYKMVKSIDTSAQLITKVSKGKKKTVEDSEVPVQLTGGEPFRSTRGRSKKEKNVSPEDELEHVTDTKSVEQLVVDSPKVTRGKKNTTRKGQAKVTFQEPIEDDTDSKSVQELVKQSLKVTRGRKKTSKRGQADIEKATSEGPPEDELKRVTDTKSVEKIVLNLPKVTRGRKNTTKKNDQAKNVEAEAAKIQFSKITSTEDAGSSQNIDKATSSSDILPPTRTKRKKQLSHEFFDSVAKTENEIVTSKGPAKNKRKVKNDEVLNQKNELEKAVKTSRRGKKVVETVSAKQEEPSNKTRRGKKVAQKNDQEECVAPKEKIVDLGKNDEPSVPRTRRQRRVHFD